MQTIYETEPLYLLVYKFQQTGYPKYFEPLFKPRVCKIRISPADIVLLEVPHFASSVH